MQKKIFFQTKIKEKKAKKKAKKMHTNNMSNLSETRVARYILGGTTTFQKEKRTGRGNRLLSVVEGKFFFFILLFFFFLFHYVRWR